MKHAQELLKQGYSAAAAASMSGISKGAISKSAVCQSIISQTEITMETTPIHTLAGLKTYFFDSVFNMHKKDYPATMDREDFDIHLDKYRYSMNEHNGCRFPPPTNRVIDRMYRAYLEQLKAQIM